MELRTYFIPLLKWWWLLVLATLVAAGSSFVVTRQMPPVYETRTTLVIGRAVYASNPASGDFYLNQQLATFYASIGQREPIRVATQDALGLQFLPSYTVSSLPDSSLIEIVVTDTDPVRAQAVANELANQLVKQTPVDDQGGVHTTFIEEQLSQLEKKITDLQSEIQVKQAELVNLFSARQISDAEKEITSLENKLSGLQDNYASLLSNTDRGAVNTLSIIEPAGLPRRPVGPDSVMNVLLAGAIALTVAAGAAYLLEYLDDTIKTPEDVARYSSQPVVGYITEIEKGKFQGPYVAKNPRSAIAEAFRSLRTDLEFSAVDRPLKTILVTSPAVSAGKTTIAVNLAIVMAQGGKKVVLVDGDLRKPSVHRYLGLPNSKGITDVFRGSLDIYNATVNWEEGGIFVVTSGDLPPNPAELLGSKKMDQILDGLERVADIVIVDGPPFLVTDAAILSSKVDGVLVVVRHGRTRKQEFAGAIKHLERSEARLLGVVMNGIPRSGDDYLGLYRYYHRYYGTEEEETTYSKNGKSHGVGLFGRKKKPAAEVAEGKD
jgi:non-specific protein-tyrosine kinase